MVKRSYASDEPKVWLQTVSAGRTSSECILLQNAFDQFSEAHQEHLIAGLAIAEVLLELKADLECVVAALLFPLHQAHPFQMDEVNVLFGHAIWRLLKDAVSMQGISMLHERRAFSSGQMENIRSMLLAMVKDPRAVLIVLAERVLLLRQAKKLSIEHQRQLANESLHVFAPLANRLGVWCIKWELEDLCFRYLDPEAYQHIAKQLDQKRIEREEALSRIQRDVTELLAEAGMRDCIVQGRIKHIYSIHQKMQRKHLSFSEVYDACALRVLVSSIDECYHALSVLQDHYTTLPHEFDDYIAQPKPNGYRSIHMVCVSPDQRVVEIQIRTHDMHHESELGAASHWNYKEGSKQTEQLADKIVLLRQVMAWHHEVDDAAGPDRAHDVFSDRVYVFTPMGDILDLPVGSTPVDFAYHIHSEVGHRTRGAKVNGKMVPLTHVLKTGDTVDILTHKFPRPSRDWLSPHEGYVVSSRARSVLAHWFRLQDQETAEKQGVSEKSSLKPQEDVVLPEVQMPSGESRRDREEVVDRDRLLTSIAKCCKPLPGDDIVSYVTRSRGISVHKRTCPNIHHLQMHFPNKFLSTDWAHIQSSFYQVDLRISYDTRFKEVLKEVMGALVDVNVEVRSIRTERHADDTGTAFVTLNLPSNMALHQMLSLLMKIEGVVSVVR